MSLEVQFHTMITMVAMGIWIGLALDTYHRFIPKKKKFHWMTALCDLLFWVIQGLVVFYILLLVNEGQMRFYIVLALLCGYAAYKALFQKSYLRILEGIIQFFIIFYRTIKRFVQIFFINPIKWLLKVIYTLCMMILSTMLTVFLWVVKIVWIPIKWLLIKIYKLTRLEQIMGWISRLIWIKKIASMIKSLLYRDNKGE